MGVGRWRRLLLVHSFNQPLWRYGRRGFGGGGNKIVGKEESPLPLGASLKSVLMQMLGFAECLKNVKV